MRSACDRLQEPSGREDLNLRPHARPSAQQRNVPNQRERTETGQWPKSSYTRKMLVSLSKSARSSNPVARLRSQSEQQLKNSSFTLALDLNIFEEHKRCVVASGVVFGNLIGNPARIRDGPATVIVEGWPSKATDPALWGLGRRPVR
jgi:hypothetical protein